MKANTWDNMTEEEKDQERKDCILADELDADERKTGYTSDSDYA